MTGNEQTGATPTPYPVPETGAESGANLLPDRELSPAQQRLQQFLNDPDTLRTAAEQMAPAQLAEVEADAHHDTWEMQQVTAPDMPLAGFYDMTPAEQVDRIATLRQSPHEADHYVAGLALRHGTYQNAPYAVLWHERHNQGNGHTPKDGPVSQQAAEVVTTDEQPKDPQGAYAEIFDLTISGSDDNWRAATQQLREWANAGDPRAEEADHYLRWRLTRDVRTLREPGGRLQRTGDGPGSFATVTRLLQGDPADQKAARTLLTYWASFEPTLLQIWRDTRGSHDQAADTSGSAARDEAPQTTEGAGFLNAVDRDVQRAQDRPTGTDDIPVESLPQMLQPSDWLRQKVSQARKLAGGMVAWSQKRYEARLASAGLQPDGQEHGMDLLASNTALVVNILNSNNFSGEGSPTGRLITDRINLLIDQARRLLESGYAKLEERFEPLQNRKAVVGILLGAVAVGTYALEAGLASRGIHTNLSSKAHHLAHHGTGHAAVSTPKSHSPAPAPKSSTGTHHTGPAGAPGTPPAHHPSGGNNPRTGEGEGQSTLRPGYNRSRGASIPVHSRGAEGRGVRLPEYDKTTGAGTVDYATLGRLRSEGFRFDAHQLNYVTDKIVRYNKVTDPHALQPGFLVHFPARHILEQWLREGSEDNLPSAA